MSAPCTANVIVKEEILDDGFGNVSTSHEPSPDVGENGGGEDFSMEDEEIEDAILLGGMGLAVAQQQLKSRNKMHEMAVKQRLISDQGVQGSGEVQLSSEERRTLVQEGYAIPSRLPLTKNEEEALKIVRRKIKNKLSAQESRRKRKEYLDALEVRVQGCVQENNMLRNRIRQLEAANRDLTMQNQQYEEQISKLSST